MVNPMKTRAKPGKAILRRSFLVTALLVIYAALNTAALFAAPLTGKALIVKGTVSATNLAGETRLLAKRELVYFQDTISTAADSFVVIKMEDNTKMTIRPESTLIIGEFDLTKGEEKGSMKLLKGALRTVTGLTGAANPDQFKLETPVVSIGIRGTDFTAQICGNDCAVTERSIEGVDYVSVTDPTLSDELNDALPPGLYFYVEEGKIYAVQCLSDSPDSCTTLDLAAGQSGYAGDQGFGIMSRVPLFIKHDPYMRFSDFTEEQLDALDVLQDEYSDSLQCDIQG